MGRCCSCSSFDILREYLCGQADAFVFCKRHTRLFPQPDMVATRLSAYKHGDSGPQTKVSSSGSKPPQTDLGQVIRRRCAQVNLLWTAVFLALPVVYAQGNWVFLCAIETILPSGNERPCSRVLRDRQHCK